MKRLSMWTIAGPKGHLFPCFIRDSKAAAVWAFCDNGDEDEGGSPPEDFRAWRKRGYRAIRVHVTPAETPK